MSNTHGLKPGDRLTINSPASPLDGLAAKYISQSPRTGACNVELLEDRGAYAKGDLVVIKQHEMS